MHYCSFCGRDNEHSIILVRAPDDTANICSECIVIAFQTMLRQAPRNTTLVFEYTTYDGVREMVMGDFDNQTGETN